ncbi:NADH dehydrogenase [ubiquinone] iron-sulfur protein 5 [Puntigrus tetrazona]|uniref:NADH dehydrogenase [ubiquinone] iron-sulfur protein 5 n=1 Tax=Puntigrus tetrazona TaxID=1606681 RepID=UPI001C8A66E5|nr:NADH dehydrogenase [ubiquinone] iron-sulfur protein 5 [Puntigrus tetrazona]
MPFLNLGINVDQWLLNQTGEQPMKRASRCHAFEKEWIECADGIGQIRAKKECKLELEDLFECMHRLKTQQRLYEVRKQRDKMIKEGAYAPPPHHTGNEQGQP